MSESPRKRVVYVGIDGGSWNLIAPMVEDGLLPNLGAAIKGGVASYLTSTVPVNSSVAWASFMTGTRPGKHGVFFFREQRWESHHRPVISFESIKAPTVFRIASEHGKKVVVLYFPLTYPVEKVNGVMLGGLLTPDRDSDFIHPPEMREELRRAVGDVPSDNEAEKIFHSSGDFKAAEASIYHVVEQTTRIAEHLLEAEGPDLLAIVYRGVDLMSHQAWCFQDPEWAAKNPGPAASGSLLVRKVYQAVDAGIGRVRARAKALEKPGEQTVFVCSSDHGFGPITWRFYLNKWLVDNGYLVLKRGNALGRFKMWTSRKLQGAMRRAGLQSWWSARGRQFTVSVEATIQDMVDWSKTRAYSAVSGGEDIVLINLKGRNPQGVVEPGAEYEELRDEIVRKLAQVRADDGTQIYPDVFKREELWGGPQLYRAPDIQALPFESSVLPAAAPVHARLVEPVEDGRPAMHRIQGMLIAEGPGLQAGVRISDPFKTDPRDPALLDERHPHVWDMGPTLLHLLGLPVEDYMDGRVLEELFTEERRRAEAVQVRSGWFVPEAGAEHDATLDAESQAKLMQTMQALGYME
ncbi:MAG TPA: alkaline phosphatase family protein [Planctomycetota bacterium]